MSERFAMCSVTGYPITRRFSRGRHHGTVATFYVYDRLYSCRNVASFTGRYKKRKPNVDDARRAAQAKCAELNRKWRAALDG